MAVAPFPLKMTENGGRVRMEGGEGTKINSTLGVWSCHVPDVHENMSYRALAESHYLCFSMELRGYSRELAARPPIRRRRDPRNVLLPYDDAHTQPCVQEVWSDEISSTIQVAD